MFTVPSFSHTSPLLPTPILPADAVVDRIGTVLRLLYIRDLRQLQTAIDRMVVEVQVGAAALPSVGTQQGPPVPLCMGAQHVRGEALVMHPVCMHCSRAGLGALSH